MTVPAAEAVYGAPPAELASVGPDATRLSPLVPGAGDVEDLASGSLSRFVALAPPGTLERRYVLAHALRALAPGGELVALAPKTRGGTRLGAELAAFGCEVVETARRHHRICATRRPAAPIGLGEAIAAGAPRVVPALGLWSQPGVFSWDRLDPGTALLLEAADGLTGRGADFGCGIGVLARRVLASPAVREILCIDLDRRALQSARRNVEDPRARFQQLDLRVADVALGELDFVIMNPPFHDGGREDRGLGLDFISTAANALRKGGVCRMVANVALPYEQRLNTVFARATLLKQGGGYKVYEAVK